MGIFEGRTTKKRNVRNELCVHGIRAGFTMQTKTATNKTLEDSLTCNYLLPNKDTAESRRGMKVLWFYLSTFPDNCVPAVYCYCFTTAFLL